MKFSLTKEEKIKVYNDIRVELQKNLIVRLNILGIDPENFDEDTYIPDESSSAQKSIYNLIQQIKQTDLKIEAIENE